MRTSVTSKQEWKLLTLVCHWMANRPDLQSIVGKECTALFLKSLETRKNRILRFLQQLLGFLFFRHTLGCGIEFCSAQ